MSFFTIALKDIEEKISLHIVDGIVYYKNFRKQSCSIY